MFGWKWVLGGIGCCFSFEGCREGPSGPRRFSAAACRWRRPPSETAATLERGLSAFARARGSPTCGASALSSAAAAPRAPSPWGPRPPGGGEEGAGASVCSRFSSRAAGNRFGGRNRARHPAQESTGRAQEPASKEASKKQRQSGREPKRVKRRPSGSNHPPLQSPNHHPPHLLEEVARVQEAGVDLCGRLVAQADHEYLGGRVSGGVVGRRRGGSSIERFVGEGGDLLWKGGKGGLEQGFLWAGWLFAGPPQGTPSPRPAATAANTAAAGAPPPAPQSLRPHSPRAPPPAPAPPPPACRGLGGVHFVEQLAKGVEQRVVVLGAEHLWLVSTRQGGGWVGGVG